MNEYIFRRKSLRKYKPQPLGEAFLKELRAFIEQVDPLYAGLRYRVEIVARKAPQNGGAPYELAFCSEDKPGALENIGFIGQKINLYLVAHDVGACWHMSRPEGFHAGELPYAIGMSFGRADEPLLREKEAFKRKSLAQISEGIDSRLEAARVAPSGLNCQNWFFVARYAHIDCYRKNLGSVGNAMLGKLSRIDIGIAIRHIAECTPDFRFAQENAPERKCWIYVGTVR